MGVPGTGKGDALPLGAHSPGLVPADVHVVHPAAVIPVSIRPHQLLDALHDRGVRAEAAQRLVLHDVLRLGATLLPVADHVVHGGLQQGAVGGIEQPGEHEDARVEELGHLRRVQGARSSSSVVGGGGCWLRRLAAVGREAREAGAGAHGGLGARRVWCGGRGV